MTGLSSGRSGARKNFVSSRTAVIFVVIVTGVLLLALPLREYFSQSAEISRMKVEEQKLQESVQNLEGQLNKWNDPQYIREQARDRLNYVLPQEYAYRVVGKDTSETAPQELAERESQRGAWYQELWGSTEQSDTEGLGKQVDGEFPHIER